MQNYQHESSQAMIIIFNRIVLVEDVKQSCNLILLTERKETSFRITIMFEFTYIYTYVHIHIYQTTGELIHFDSQRW